MACFIPNVWMSAAEAVPWKPCLYWAVGVPSQRLAGPPSAPCQQQKPIQACPNLLVSSSLRLVSFTVHPTAGSWMIAMFSSWLSEVTTPPLQRCCAVVLIFLRSTVAACARPGMNGKRIWTFRFGLARCPKKVATGFKNRNKNRLSQNSFF